MSSIKESSIIEDKKKDENLTDQQNLNSENSRQSRLRLPTAAKNKMNSQASPLQNNEPQKSRQKDSEKKDSDNNWNENNEDEQNDIDNVDNSVDNNDFERKFSRNSSLNVLDLTELRNKSASRLLQDAEELDIPNLGGMSKQDLIINISKKKAAENSNLLITSSGVAEVLNEGFAFIRSGTYNYLASQDDVYVSPGQVRKLGIRTGDSILGEIRAPKKEERYFALARAIKINGADVSTARKYINFESLVPCYPNASIKLECQVPKKILDNKIDLSGRIIDIISPIGRGQRALIVAQPKTGKTILLQSIAHSISSNYPDIQLIILLIDERPEEVTDMKRSVNAEVISSTFDEPAEKHVYVAEFVIERVKRLVEQGQHVVVLLDSITRLARAYNSVVPSSGKLLSGGVDSNALQKAKRLFGAARNIEGGGSLTIIGTALVDTGSRMDELIYEEFKGTGNSEIILDRKLAEKRLFPAIDITKSGTRKEELLLDNSILNKVWILRRILNQMSDAEAMEFMLDKLQRTKTNDEFFLFMDRKGQ